MTYTYKHIGKPTGVQVYSGGVQNVDQSSPRTTVLWIQARQIRRETDKYAIYRPRIK